MLFQLFKIESTLSVIRFDLESQRQEQQQKFNI
jgi:hypothetical protein